MATRRSRSDRKPSEPPGQDGFYVPRFEVRIEGVGLPRDVLRDVVQVTYQDDIKEIDSFDLTVNNWDADAAASSTSAPRPRS